VCAVRPGAALALPKRCCCFRACRNGAFHVHARHSPSRPHPRLSPRLSTAQVKLCLNPFYHPLARITSRDFDDKVRALARRYLGFRA
jgi:hypothetical protein